MAGSNKICVICGEDCSSRPRVKSPDGQYACRACMERREAERAAPAALSNDDFALDDQEGAYELDDRFADLEAPVVEANPCPGCGMPKAPGAAMCMNCGLNAATGQRVATSVKKESKAGAVAVQAGGAIASPILGLVGGCVGGLLGTALWAALIYTTGYEIGFLAWGIGFAVGLGTVIGVRGKGTVLTGFMAMVIAILSIAGGKYFGAKLYFETLSRRDTFADMTLDRDDVMQYLVDETVYDMLDAGEQIDWPDPDMTVDDAIWPDDYPLDLQQQTRAYFDGLTREEQIAVEAEAKDAMGVSIAAAAGDIVASNYWFLWDFWDFIWLILAISTAYKVGAAESD